MTSNYIPNIKALERQIDRVDNENMAIHSDVLGGFSFDLCDEFHASQLEADCEEFGLDPRGLKSSRSCIPIPVITDPERQKREFDSGAHAKSKGPQPSQQRYENSVTAALKRVPRVDTPRSENGGGSDSLICKEQIPELSRYSASDDSALRVHNTPVFAPMFEMGAPAAGCTSPGHIFNHIKNMIKNKPDKTHGEKQLEYACRGAKDVVGCKICYKLMLSKDLNRHMHEVDCSLGSRYKFAKMPHPDGSGLVYFCPVGCGMWKERYKLVWHLASSTSHPEEVLAKFGFCKRILQAASCEEFKTRKALLENASIEVGPKNDKLVANRYTVLRIRELKK